MQGLLLGHHMDGRVSVTSNIVPGQNVQVVRRTRCQTKSILGECGSRASDDNVIVVMAPLSPQARRVNARRDLTKLAGILALYIVVQQRGNISRSRVN